MAGGVHGRGSVHGGVACLAGGMHGREVCMPPVNKITDRQV